jgi:hypothetical protein
MKALQLKEELLEHRESRDGSLRGQTQRLVEHKGSVLLVEHDALQTVLLLTDGQLDVLARGGDLLNPEADLFKNLLGSAFHCAHPSTASYQTGLRRHISSRAL